ncbi:MAG TPA: hypothetical protein VEK57_03395 [Thermoanaerobaculia bacterium]|nr:hypothetical protein [Thermoanaerobaculia bacterium]
MSFQQRLAGRAASVLLVLCAALGASAAPAFLSVSDLHFNPFYDPSLVDQLAAAEPSAWPAIFATSKITAPSAYDSDTNYPLFQSFLADLKLHAKGARFATITGDFLAHQFPQNFQKYATDKSPQAFQSFVTKTIQFIATQFQLAAPGLTIYPVIGNNDSDCGDYNVTPGGWFLPAFANAWAPSSGTSDFVRQFSPTGHFAIEGSIPDTTIIGVNSIYFSPKFTNACGTAGTDYGAQELAWLSGQLASAKKRGRRVWLLYHIPPGIDVYDTITYGGACPTVTAALFWKSSYATTFGALMTRYASTIKATLAGHTHMDDFRLLYGKAAAPLAYIHITPAVSPVFGNNPAYERMTYSPAGATIVDYTVHSLPLSATTPAWGEEYAFRAAYGQNEYTPRSIGRVRTAIQTSTATRALYGQYYTVSSPNTIINQNSWTGYWCGTGTSTGNAFQACYCAAPSP